MEARKCIACAIRRPYIQVPRSRKLDVRVELRKRGMELDTKDAKCKGSYKAHLVTKEGRAADGHHASMVVVAGT